MVLFSERHGHKSPQEIVQREGMDRDLRIGLWNAVSLLLNRSADPLRFYEDYQKLVFVLWMDFFKLPADTIENYCNKNYEFIRDKFMAFEWFEVYDFLEFLYKNISENQDIFLKYCNKILKRENSAYQFVSGLITPIISEEEVQEIEIASKSPFSSVNNHILRALELLSNKTNPDYRNSIKESISAVESICKLITKRDKSTLAQALIVLERNDVSLHSALRASFDKLYGYTNDEGGIRHSLLEDSKILSYEDARFMLVTCSSFVNYLKVKAEKII